LDARARTSPASGPDRGECAEPSEKGADASTATGEGSTGGRGPQALPSDGRTVGAALLLPLALSEEPSEGPRLPYSEAEPQLRGPALLPLDEDGEMVPPAPPQGSGDATAGTASHAVLPSASSERAGPGAGEPAPGGSSSAARSSWCEEARGSASEVRYPEREPRAEPGPVSGLRRGSGGWEGCVE
jgi:hypothetical protein